MGGQDLYRQGLLLQQLTDEDGQQILGLQGIARNFLLKEDPEVLLQSGQEGRGQAPQVHGYVALRVQLDAIGYGIGLDVLGLHHVGQESVPHLADAPGDAAVVGEGVFQDEARHAERIVRMILLEVVVDLLIDALAVVVVGVDDGEGGVDEVLGGKDGLAGAPGLGPALRQGAGDIRQGLEAVAYLHAVGGAHFLDPGADDLPEVLLNVLTDDEQDLIESSLNGVVDGVVHNNMAGSVYTGQLLDAAAVPAADARRHNDQGRLFQKVRPPYICIYVYK